LGRGGGGRGGEGRRNQSGFPSVYEPLEAVYLPRDVDPKNSFRSLSAINSQRGGEITLFFWIARWSGMQSIPVFSAALRSEGRPNVSGKKLFLH